MTLILTILGMIPGLAGIAERITGKWFDTKVNILSARLGADKEVIRGALVQAGVEAQTGVDRLRIIAQSPVLLAILAGFAGPWIIYEWKVVVWDNVLMGGAASTPEIKGLVAAWAGVILAGIFGTGGAMALANAWFANRPKS